MTYATTKIPKALADEIDKLIKAKIKGYRTRMEFVVDAVREKLMDFDEELKEPRFKHINIYSEESRATLWDNQRKELYDVYMRNGEMRCEKDDSKNCEHVQFVIELPKVKEGYRKKGWKLPDIE